MNIMRSNRPNAKQLDKQSIVYISKWVDIDSPEAKANDDNRVFTKKVLNMLLNSNDLFTDELGRVWGQGKENFYPFHLEVGKQLWGIKIIKNAAN